MSEYVSASLRRLIAERARHRCEYCLIHADDVLLPHEPDHIIATKHGGETVAENLALARFVCNRHKGTDLASVDPDSGSIERLFHPRRHRWDEHFRLDDSRIMPLTSVGRTTSFLLKFNLSRSVAARKLLQAAGRYPR